MGLAGLSGLGGYRGLAAVGTLLNNLSNEYMVLGINMALGLKVTDRLSVGRPDPGPGFEQLGFIGGFVSSAMVHGYGRGAPSAWTTT